MKSTSTDVIQRRVFPASHQMKFRKIPNLKTFCGWMFSLPHVRLQSLKQFENSKLYQPRTAYTFNGIIYVYNMLVAVPFKFYMENMSYLPQHAMKLLMKQKTLFKTNFHHDLSLDARIRTHTHTLIHIWIFNTGNLFLWFLCKYLPGTTTAKRKNYNHQTEEIFFRVPLNWKNPVKYFWSLI